ncbi:hypothetical protein [Sphingomonas sp.]|uniref:hypothetical protein n=1 Tax=Sphingomonas sp. TaxID=28214 RepID=UPI002DD64D32|nr:hypothetical protein [Sphingomonas sp.]
MTDTVRPGRDRPQFFATSALVMLALVLASFSFTYFWPVATRTRSFSIVLHIHGAAYFAWVALYAWQTRLVAKGRVARHREWGLAGIALSALMIPLGIAIAIAAARKRTARGDAHPFDFTIYNVVDVTTFAILMTASIAAVTRHPQWHRRFTFGAALCLVGPSLSRWLQIITEVPPWTDLLPNLAADLFLIALALHDRRTLGRVHPATWVTAAVLVPIHVATPFLATSDAWRAIGPCIMALAV